MGPAPRSSLLERSPLRVLIPAAVGLLVLLIAVVATDRPEHGFHAPLDVSGIQPLFEPSATPDQITARADALLREHDIDPDWYFRGVWLDYDRALLEHLRAEHGDAALVEFARRGAPVVTLGVSYFRPLDKVARYASLSVTLDPAGEVVGFSRWEFDPNAMRDPVSDAWVADARRRVAARLGLSEDRLVRRSTSDFVGTTVAKADAIWELSDPRLGTARVIVAATQRGDALTFSKQVFDPAMTSLASDIVTTTAYWAAVMLAIAIAFLLGACAFRNDGDDTDRTGPIALAGGFALAAVGCATQGAALVAADLGAIRLGGILLFGAAAFLGALGVVCWRAARRGTAPVPVPRRLRITLIAIVVLAFVAMSMTCSGFLDEGCTRPCGLIRYTSAPLAVLALVVAARRPRFGAYAALLAATTLIPHCTCDNFVNHPWIARIGLSPMCYFFPFVVTLLAALGLRGVYPRLFVAIVAVGAAAVTLVGIGHQMYGFPW